MAFIAIDVPDDLLAKVTDPQQVALAAIRAAATGELVPTHAGIRIQNELDRALADVRAITALIEQAAS